MVIINLIGYFLNSIRPSFQSRLRLVAVHSVLKLARKKIYDSMISAAELQELALMIQVSFSIFRLSFEYFDIYSISNIFHIIN